MSSKRKRSKDLDYYLGLPWANEFKSVKIPPEEGGGFCVSVPLLGEKLVRGDGDSEAEAIENARLALEEYLEEALEAGEEVSEPAAAPACSGTFLVRTSKSLHTRLMEEARREGISLNHLVGLLLERGLSQYKVEESLERLLERSRRGGAPARRAAKR